MSFENTSLMSEVNQILATPSKGVNNRWRAVIRANNEELSVVKVMSIELGRRYATDFGDTMFIEVLIMEGQYWHRIFPYKQDLVLTLYRERAQEVTGRELIDEDIENQEFRAVIVDDGSKNFSRIREDVQDLSSIKQVRFQLIDQSVEQLRLMTVGTVVRNTAPGDAVKMLYTHVSKDITVDDEATVLGVDIYEPDNTEPYPQLVIPHGTPVTDVAELVQNTAGVYSTGIGSYLQNGIWYVYPLYDYTRYENTTKSLTLIEAPGKRFGGSERTFRKTGNQVIALVTGDVNYTDLSERNQLTEGNGVRFSDPKRLFKAFGITDQNKASVLREELNNELVASQRVTGLNHTPFSSQRVTANKFAQLSALAARNGSFIVCHWENSDIDAVYPGMPVKYMYVVNSNVHELTGVVLEANHYIASAQPGITPGGYSANSALMLFIDRKQQAAQKEGTET